MLMTRFPLLPRLSGIGRVLRFAMLPLALLAAPAHADRIKDLGTFQGVRANQLSGYGIVVGLAGPATTASNIRCRA
jgi:flagellar basal body P-ring protein FlgI